MPAKERRSEVSISSVVLSPRTIPARLIPRADSWRIRETTSLGKLGFRPVPEPAGTRGYDDLRRRADREPLGRGLRPQIASADDLARTLGALDRADPGGPAARRPYPEGALGAQWTGAVRDPASRDFQSGSDGTRTRDLRRDRPVMALPG
jgi:hypothetical protein